MATSVGKEDTKLEMLQDLIKLDHAAAEAYEAAINRLDDPSYRQQLEAFKRDHERHIMELTPIVQQMGGKAPDSGGAKEMLTQGKVVLSGLMGDKAILKAMKTNEDDTNTAYERVAAKAPLEARNIVERGLADERRHRDWILAQLGEGTSATRSQSGMRGKQDESQPGYHGPH